MHNFFKLLSAGPAFFLSAWLLMVFAGIVGQDIGVQPFGYPTAMVATIGLWLAIVPAAGAVGSAGHRARWGWGNPAVR